MSTNSTQKQIKSSNETKDNNSKSKTQLWDRRLGDWAPLDDSTQLPSYTKLLFIEPTLFIIREYKFCNRETDGNRYLIKNGLADNLFYGIERSSASNGICFCGSKRAFDLTFYDRNRAPALHLRRPFRFDCCGLIPFCKQKIEIKDNSNKNIGKVTEKCNFCRLSLKLTTNQTELQIYGPDCEMKLSYCLDDLCFQIYDKSVSHNSQQSSGHICKLSDLSSGGHIFQVKFGKDWSPDVKALVIGATILIDYYYFDNTYHESKYHRLTTSSASSELPPFPLVIRHNNSEDDTQQS